MKIGNYATMLFIIRGISWYECKVRVQFKLASVFGLQSSNRSNHENWITGVIEDNQIY